MATPTTSQLGGAVLSDGTQCNAVDCVALSEWAFTRKNSPAGAHQTVGYVRVFLFVLFCTRSAVSNESVKSEGRTTLTAYGVVGVQRSASTLDASAATRSLSAAQILKRPRDGQTGRGSLPWLCVRLASESLLRAGAVPWNRPPAHLRTHSASKT